MAVVKLSVIYPLLLFGFVVFLFVSQTPQVEEKKSSRKYGPGARVKLHKATAAVNPKLDHIPFDPIVREFEEAQDDRVWEKARFEDWQKAHQGMRDAHEEKLRKLREYAQAEAHGSHHDEIDIGHHETKEDHKEEEHIEEDYSDQDDYFDYEHFNITTRLMTLFPLIDVNPVDGKISEDELAKWHLDQARKTSLHRTDRELESLDTDYDGHVTLKEYLHDTSPGEEINKEEWTEYDRDWKQVAMEQFPIADLDKDKKLNRFEFNDFLHPEDSENPELLAWLRREEIRNRDVKDKDGRLSWEEFNEALFGELRDFGEEDPLEQTVKDLRDADPHGAQIHYQDAMSKKLHASQGRFSALDVNNDEYLTEDELEPIMEKLTPGEKHYAREQAQHMIEQADNNADKLLTVEEMAEHPYVFYNTAYDQEEDKGHNHENYEPYLSHHEEFR